MLLNSPPHQQKILLVEVGDFLRRLKWSLMMLLEKWNVKCKILIFILRQLLRQGGNYNRISQVIVAISMIHTRQRHLQLVAKFNSLLYTRYGFTSNIYTNTMQYISLSIIPRCCSLSFIGYKKIVRVLAFHSFPTALFTLLYQIPKSYVFFLLILLGIINSYRAFIAIFNVARRQSVR